MHLVCCGIVKFMLKKFCLKGSSHKLPDPTIAQLSRRLHAARQYCPSEFQRKPDSLEFLPSRKATRYCMFVLYLGFTTFYDILDEAYLKNFHLLFVAMRFMTRAIKINDEDKRKEILKKFGNISGNLLRSFVEGCLKLFALSPDIPNISTRLKRRQLCLG